VNRPWIPATCALVSTGCALTPLPEPAAHGVDDGAPPAALVPFVDLDPDPRVVEVELVATRAAFSYLPGSTADVWAYRDGSRADSVAGVPGPLLEARRGDRVLVHFRNELPYGTTVHWHGLRLPAPMDGAHQVVLPGEAYDYDFVARDAGTFWYHPHVRADEQIEKGLHGAFVVRDDLEPLPVAERVLVLDDVKLTESGALDPRTDHLDVVLGRQGNTFVVNGVPQPELQASTGSRERWRLINAANGRFFDLALSRGTFQVIGVDGGLIGEPYVTDRLLIAPGERFDVLVTLEGEAGEQVSLSTHHHDRGHGLSDPGPLEVLTIQLKPGEPQLATAPAAQPVEPLDVAATDPVRAMVLTEELEADGGPQFRINDELWPFNTTIPVELGATEIWEVRNEADGDHPFHLHGTFFQVLADDGAPRTPVAWKDTVLVPRRSTLRFAVRFDEPGTWMFHCQIPEHAERGMMGDLMVSP
jgi:FtsP/CotA-like multicopper oxidase with cupredoxin domain